MTSIVSWIVKKILDYGWSRGKTMIAKGQMKTSSNLLAKFGKLLMDFTLHAMIESEPPNGRAMNPAVLRTFETPYMLHDSLHRMGVLDTETCDWCKSIMRKKEYLKRMTPNLEQYLPFKRFANRVPNEVNVS